MALRLSWPLAVHAVTQEFGNKFILDGVDVYAKWGYPGHNGIDFRAAIGRPVLACDAGLMESTPEDPGGFGTYVRIRHWWGLSYYAHLSEKVAPGLVAREQMIGKSGDSGFSTGPHLHFGIKVTNAPCPGYKTWSDASLFLDGDLEASRV